MSGQRLSDARIAGALREYLPAEPYGGLHERIRAQVHATPQSRSIRALRGLGYDQAARRRMLLVMAAALLALILGTVGVVGALIELERRQPNPALVLDPPADLASFARSAYEEMDQLPPLSLAAVDSEGPVYRIYVDSSGAVRIEEFASLGATEPDEYRIYSGTTMGHSLTADGRRVWYEQSDAISEDPRVFVYATLGGARSAASAGCEVAISPGEVHPTTPASAWEWVGAEYVAGRPTHHLRCGDELWLDDETRLTMRSRGQVLDAAGLPIDGRFRTVEVVDIRFEQPAADLFELSRPADAASVSDEDYGCATDPYCSASPRPIVSPPPAPAADDPEDIEAVIVSALASFESLPAFEAVIERTNTKYPADEQTRVLYDGAGRFRLEQTFQPGSRWEVTTITLVGPDYLYTGEPLPDGSMTWRSAPDRRGDGYPLAFPPSCPTEWRHVGVDLVGGRVADHLSCQDAGMDPDYWVDRETGLVLRAQSLTDERWGTDVREVTELSFEEQPPALFELPPGVVIEDPN